MRVNTVLASRPDWYDRNAVTKVNSYANTGVAPHGTTTRWSYTVPAGKKFALQAGQAMISRDAVAGVAVGAFCNLRVTPSGGAASSVLFSVDGGNSLNGGMSNVFGTTLVLVAGDALEATTSDPSTGGSHAFAANSEGVEFDA